MGLALRSLIHRDALVSACPPPPGVSRCPAHSTSSSILESNSVPKHFVMRRLIHGRAATPLSRARSSGPGAQGCSRWLLPPCPPGPCGLRLPGTWWAFVQDSGLGSRGVPLAAASPRWRPAWLSPRTRQQEPHSFLVLPAPTRQARGPVAADSSLSSCFPAGGMTCAGGGWRRRHRPRTSTQGTRHPASTLLPS